MNSADIQLPPNQGTRNITFHEGLPLPSNVQLVERLNQLEKEWTEFKRAMRDGLLQVVRCVEKNSS